jgi:hypothetical protein
LTSFSSSSGFPPSIHLLLFFPPFLGHFAVGVSGWMSLLFLPSLFCVIFAVASFKTGET